MMLQEIGPALPAKLENTRFAEDIKTPAAAIRPVDQDFFLAGGHLIPWQGKVQVVRTPFKANGLNMKVGSYPMLDAEAALEAVNAAEAAFKRGLGEWPRMTPEGRISAVLKFVELLKPKREEISRLIMNETAKTLSDSYKEFDRTVEYIEKTVQDYRELLNEESGRFNFEGISAYTDRAALGVTLCMGPFNYPFNETMTVLIPALITGNTVVLKPAKFGVLLFAPLLEPFKDCFPSGVVNVVYGDGSEVITPIMESGKVDALAFIGSTKVANLICARHPEPHRLTKVLGLGAHNYALIREDAKLDEIMPEIVKGSLSFNGQRCTSLALHFVHEDLADAYAEKLAEAVEKLKAGLPDDPEVAITALVEGPDKVKYLQSLIEDAVGKGARVLNTGGGRLLDENLMIPAVLYPVTSEMLVYSKEQFGPVIAVSKFREEGQVLNELANSNFGQQISLFGENKQKLFELALKAKTLVQRVNINLQCQRGPDELPFGGRKDSALGVLSIREALKAFTLQTVLAIKE